MYESCSDPRILCITGIAFDGSTSFLNLLTAFICMLLDGRFLQYTDKIRRTTEKRFSTLCVMADTISSSVGGSITCAVFSSSGNNGSSPFLVTQG